MKKPRLGFLLLFSAILFSVSFFVSIAEAATGINHQIYYQGLLKNSSGTELSGSYDMVFKIYDSSSGGNLLWTGTYTSGNSNAVSVSDGLFNVLLGSGSGNTLSLDFNSDSYYLGITVGSDSEMTPRQRLASAGYAFNADTIDGVDSTSILQTGGGSISTSTSNVALTITQSGVGNSLNVLDGTTNVFTILDGGNVGIATSSPYAKLSVTGQVVGQYFSATSTTATSTLPNLSITQNLDLGVVINKHKDGTQTVYKPSANTDAARGTALASAVSAAIDGDTVLVGPGTFALGNAILNMSSGGTRSVSLVGSGRYQTVITSSADLTTLGPIIQPSDDSVVQSLSVTGTLSNSTYQAGVGWTYTVSHPTTPNVLIKDVYISSGSDGFYLMAGPASENYTVRIEDVEVSVLWDGISTFMNDPENVATVNLSVVNASVTAASGFAGNPTEARCIVAGAGTSTISGGSCYSAKDGIVADAADEFTARTYIIGTKISTAGAASTYDIKNINDNSTLYVSPGTSFDRTRTSGTITYLDTVADDVIATRLGVATSSPWRTLSVTGTVGFDGLTGSTGAGSLCLSSTKQVVYNSGSDACQSSVRSTKHDIVPLDLDGQGLISELTPVSFIYNEGDGKTRYGFIAEDTAKVDDHLVTYNDKGEVSGIDDRSILSLIVSGVQEIGASLGSLVTTESLSGLTTSLSTETPRNALTYFTKRVTDGLRPLLELVVARVTAVRGYFGSVHTEKLCLQDSTSGEVCVDAEKLKSLLNQQKEVQATPPAVSISSEPAVVNTESTKSLEEATGTEPNADRW